MNPPKLQAWPPRVVVGIGSQQGPSKQALSQQQQPVSSSSSSSLSSSSSFVRRVERRVVRVVNASLGPLRLRLAPLPAPLLVPSSPSHPQSSSDTSSDSAPIIKASLEKRSTLAPGMSDLLEILVTATSYAHYRAYITLLTDQPPDPLPLINSPHTLPVPPSVNVPNDSIYTDLTFDPTLLVADHYQQRGALVVPVEVFPVMNPRVLVTNSSTPSPSASSFLSDSDPLLPSRVDFGACPLADPVIKKFTLQNVIPLEFDFEVVVMVPHPFFQIYPLKGTIPPESEVEITVTYNPLEMCTSSCKIKLLLSQYGYVPIVTTFCGSATARYDGYKAGVELPQIRGSSQVPQRSVPVQSSPPASQGTRRKKSAHKTSKVNPTGDPPLSPSRLKSSLDSQNTTISNPNATMEVNGIVFDTQTLSTHAGVASILMQQPGKEKVKEVKARRKSAAGGATDFAEGEGIGEASKQGRQVKELVFGHLVKANMEYERSKELKWFVCTGRLPFTEEEKIEILRERDPSTSEGPRLAGSTGSGRVVTPAHSQPQFNPSFDTRKNSAWSIRAWAIKRFVSAVRRVIVQLRASKRLTSMHAFFKKCGYDKMKIAELAAAEWSSGRPPTSLAYGVVDNTEDTNVLTLELKDSRVKYPYFPEFRKDLSFFGDETLLSPLPVPHIKEIVQVFDELGTFELKVNNSIAQDYHSFSLSSSRVGSYIPRSFQSRSAASPSNAQVGTPPTAPISPALGMRMGAHEEDLSSMSSIQSLVLRQQAPDKQDQETVQEPDLQDLAQDQHEMQPIDEQAHDHEEQEQVEQPVLSLEQFSSLLNPLANLYLPSLPQEFLKAPRAGPPTSTSTLDILRTVIVYASPPAITETDVIYPLRPYRRDVDLPEGLLEPEPERPASRPQSIASRSTKAIVDMIVTSTHMSSVPSQTNEIHTDMLLDAWVPELVSPGVFTSSVEDEYNVPTVDLASISSQYFIPIIAEDVAKDKEDGTGQQKSEAGNALMNPRGFDLQSKLKELVPKLTNPSNANLFAEQ